MLNEAILYKILANESASKPLSVVDRLSNLIETGLLEVLVAR